METALECEKGAEKEGSHLQLKFLIIGMVRMAGRDNPLLPSHADIACIYEA